MPISTTRFSRLSIGWVNSEQSLVAFDPADTEATLSIESPVVLGTSGSAFNAISTQTVTLTLPIVTANDSVTSDIPFAAVSLGDSIIVTPDSDWSTDLVLTATASDGTVTVIANNSTITDITPSPQPARLTAICFSNFT